MTRLSRFFTLIIGGALLLAACTPSGESGLSGTLLFADQPLSGAQVEIYLKAEKDRSTQPFAVTTTDNRGRFQLTLPSGNYFLIGKLRHYDQSGRTRMLMAECPANPLTVTDGLREIAPFSLREMGRDGQLVADPDTGVSGRVTLAGKALKNAYVYVYSEDAAGMMGPSFGDAVLTDSAGRFDIPLPAGKFFLAARKRADGARMGEPQAGDYNGIYADNPLRLERGEIHDIGDLELKVVSVTQRAARLSQGKFAATGTALSGRMVDSDGAPVAGVYAFAYLDSRMVGKPTYISAPTGEDGRFTLHLGSGGTYYIGARSTFGGPLEPGEWVGTYDQRPDHGVAVSDGKTAALGALTVREVW